MKRVWRILGALVVVIAALLAWLIFGPSEIDPAAWSPPPAPPLTGAYAQNRALDTLKLAFDGQLTGPEDIARDAAGRFYTGVADGRIVRFTDELKTFEMFANTGGRPLGMQFDSRGNLIVCDAHKGLLSIDSNGAVTVLTTECDSRPFGFTDDLDIAADGTIYFTDASDKFHAPNYMADLMELRGNGRFLRYDPVTKTTRCLVDKLFFANGVAISPDQSFVLVNETWKYRVMRYRIADASWEVFLDSLPGFPDNISSNGRDTFWVALANPRNPKADALAPYPALRRMLWKLPKAVLPAAVPYSFVLGLDIDGKVTHNLQGPTGVLAPITSVNEYGDYLYFGSVEDDAIGRAAAPR